MSDPLSLLPFAVAARPGRVDGVPVAPLVAAGITLLQRAAPLVRALAGGRSALLLDDPAMALVALAASDGRETVMLDPAASVERWYHAFRTADVRAVFTTATMLRRMEAWASASGGTPLVVVLLDEAPERAHVVLAERRLDVDLGSHHGLSLEGDQDAEGRDEPLVRFDVSDHPDEHQRFSHRDALARCRALARSVPLATEDSVAMLDPLHTPAGFLALGASLLAGAAVTTVRPANAEALTPGTAPARTLDAATVLLASDATVQRLAGETTAGTRLPAMPRVRVVYGIEAPLSARSLAWLEARCDIDVR